MLKVYEQVGELQHNKYAEVKSFWRNSTLFCHLFFENMEMSDSTQV